MDIKLTKIYNIPGGYWKSLAAIKNYREQPRSRKTPQKSGWSSRRFGRSISQRRGALLVQNSTCPPPTRSTKRTFFFWRTTNCPEGAKFSSTCWQLPTWPAATKRSNPGPQKNSDEVEQAFQKICKRSPLKWPKMLQFDPGHEFMELLQKRWKPERHVFAAGARKFTATRLSVNVSTASWLSACSVTSTPWKCGSLPASGPWCGWKGSLKLLPLWTTK